MRRHLLAASISALAMVSAAPALAAPPMDQAMLQIAATKPEVQAFYARTSWRAAWDSRDEKALRAALADARRHAIDGERYLRQLDAVSSPAAKEAMLTEIALAYGHTLAFGQVNPETLFSLYTVDRSTGDLQGGLAAALAKNNLRAWFVSLAPQDAEYGALSSAYLAASDAGQADRARQLAVNLERRRWLSRHPGERRIDVNTAATYLEYYRDGQVADRRRVVAGKSDTPTPQLGSTMTRLVVNPPWNVPAGIARKEILPKGRSYLKSHNMYVENGRVVQRPGPNSSLGIVKFDLDNPYAIYLHDTPSKSFFNSDERHRSHGCVRVQDAEGFARLLAGDSGVADEFEGDLATGKTGTVDVTDIPVRLLYHTAYLDPESGQIAYAKDAYGHDAKVAQALGLQKAAKGGSKAAGGDSGP